MVERLLGMNEPKPNHADLFACRTEPNRTRAIYEDLGGIIGSFTLGAWRLNVSVVLVDLVSNFDMEMVLSSVRISQFLSI